MGLHFLYSHYVNPAVRYLNFSAQVLARTLSIMAEIHKGEVNDEDEPAYRGALRTHAGTQTPW